MEEAVTVLLLALLAAPQLTGPATAVAGAKQVLENAGLDVRAKITVKAAGRVSGAGYRAVEATISADGATARAFGFGDSEPEATRDAGRRAARQLAGKLVRQAAAAKPPTVDPQGGTLVRLEGLHSFAALAAALEFLRSRDATASVTLIAEGVPTVRLAKTASPSGVAAASRGLSVAGYVLKSQRADGATLTLSFEAQATSVDTGPDKPARAMDDEDVPR